MAKLHTLALALLCFSTCNCSVTKNSTGGLKFSPIPEVDISSTITSEFDGKGLEPWYDIAKSFIHTVQKDDVPYDEIQKIKDGDFEAAEFLKGWELPFLVVFAIGVLFAIIVPIVGFCFCCCRCCGNCGGEMVQKPTSKADLKRVVFGIALSIITLLMFAGCLMAFVSNDRITDTVESYKTTPVRAIRDAEQYFNETLNVVTGTVISNVVDVLDIIVKDVKEIPSNIAGDIKGALSASVQEPLEDVVKLGNDTERMGALLKKINATTFKLQSKFKNLTGKIDEVKKDINTDCNPTLCPGIDADSLTTDANFTALPDVEEELNNIAEINNGNLSTNAQKGLDQFNNIDVRIRNESNSSTSNIVNETERARDEFEENIQTDIVDKVNEQILKKTDGWVADIEKWFDDVIKPGDKYRYYAGVGLTCLVLIPVVLLAVGLLCGIFGHDKHAGPTERGAISNMGGNCLMAAVGFMFIFVLFLMLFAAICFFLGGHLEKACYSVREETIYSDFIDQPKYWDNEYILAEAFYNNGSIKLTLGHVLQECRKNTALFEAIQGKNKWNLKEKFNVKDKIGDIDTDLGGFNVPVQDQQILNDETKKGLEDLANSSVEAINFQKFFDETNKDIVNNTQIDEMQSTLNKTNNDTIKISNDLEEIQNEAREMKALSDKLKVDVEALRGLGGDIKNKSNKILKDAEKAEGDYQGQVNDIVQKSVDKFSDNILGYIDQTTDWAADSIEKDLGRCRILTDVYDGVVNLICRDTVYPFNGYWFSIGFCLFFYIPAIILAVKLAKHYRRMRFEEGFDRHEGNMHEMHERNNKPWHNQGNTVYPK